MDKKRIIIFSCLILLILVIVIIAWFFWRDNEPAELPGSNINAEKNTDELISQRVSELPPPANDRVAEEESYPLDLRQLSFSVAERFGSYSSDEPFKNLLDLEMLMTSRMRASMERIMESSAVSDRDFEGYDAKALSSNLLSYSEQSAEIIVKVQRTSYLGRESQTTSVFYQDLYLKFIKDDESWLLDEAEWQ